MYFIVRNRYSFWIPTNSFAIKQQTETLLSKVIVYIFINFLYYFLVNTQHVTSNNIFNSIYVS